MIRSEWNGVEHALLNRLLATVRCVALGISYPLAGHFGRMRTAEALTSGFTPYAVALGSDLPVAGGPAYGPKGRQSLAQGFYPGNWPPSSPRPEGPVAGVILSRSAAPSGLKPVASRWRPGPQPEQRNVI